MKHITVLFFSLLLLINTGFAATPLHTYDSGDSMMVENHQPRPLKSYLTPIPKDITMLREKSQLTHNQLHSCKQYINSLHRTKMRNLSSLTHVHFLSFHLDTMMRPQQYKLKIGHSHIDIYGGDKAAVFYGMRTLYQIIDYALTENTTLPCLVIHDEPDFRRRGFLLDISRTKVPKMSTLYKIIDFLSDWKVNELQLYTEHTFAYKNHKEVWEGCSPMTADEIRALDAYCRERFIDLVPNQNSFGHMENWLRHEEYQDLAECTEDCDTRWGKKKLTSLDPTNPGSLALMKELYAELLPNFSSQYFNIGCDETVELGHGCSKGICDSLGAGRVYLNFLLSLNKEVNDLGRRTMFWGDIIINHKELIPEIPKDMIAMVWGYDRNYDFNAVLPAFMNAGLDFYVCPGTSTWRSLIGRNSIAKANLYHAAYYGKKYGAKGYLVTNWGDYGHWQPLSVCYPMMILGTAYAWNLDTSALSNLEYQLNHYLFKDETELTAKAVLQLGDACNVTHIPEGVANAYHLMLHRYLWTMKGNYQTREMKIAPLQKSEMLIDSALAVLSKARPRSTDARIVVDELNQAARLAKHGIHLGIARLSVKGGDTADIPLEKRQELAKELKPLIDQHKKLWIVRNREGGLKESVGHLQDLYDYYLKCK